MTLIEKILKLYPKLKQEDLMYPLYPEAPIAIQNNSDGNGDFIAKWDHPTLSKPTNEELK